MLVKVFSEMSRAMLRRKLVEFTSFYSGLSIETINEQ